MITSIVRKVQGLLREANRRDIEVEIVFPVSPEAITTEQQVCVGCVWGGRGGMLSGVWGRCRVYVYNKTASK